MLVEEQAEVVDEEPELLERLRLTVQVPQRLALVPRAPLPTCAIPSPASWTHSPTPTDLPSMPARAPNGQAIGTWTTCSKKCATLCGSPARRRTRTDARGTNARRCGTCTVKRR